MRRSRWVIAILIFIALDLWWADRLLNPTVLASFYDQQTAATSTIRTFWTDETGKTNLSLPQFAFDRFLPPKDYRVTVSLQADYRRSGLPDLNLLDRQPSFNSFDPLRPEGFERFIRLLNAAPTPALFRAAAVGRVYDGSGQVISSFENATVPRVWIARQVKVVQSPEEAEKVLTATDWSPEQSVVIEGNPPPLDEALSAQDSANITQETSLEMTISTDTVGHKMLVIADTYYPGWEATVDGAPATIYRANLAFRALVLLEGKHTVHLVYRPASLVIGSLVSLVTLVMTIGLLGVAVIRRMRLGKTTLE